MVARLIVILMAMQLVEGPIGVYIVSSSPIFDVGQPAQLTIAIKNLSDKKLEGNVTFSLKACKSYISEKWANYSINPSSIHIDLAPGETIFVNLTLSSNTYLCYLLIVSFNNYHKNLTHIVFVGMNIYRVKVPMGKIFLALLAFASIAYLLRSVERRILFKDL